MTNDYIIREIKIIKRDKTKQKQSIKITKVQT